MVALPNASDIAYSQILTVLSLILPNDLDLAYVACECLAEYSRRKERRARLLENRASKFSVISLNSENSQRWHQLALSVHGASSSREATRRTRETPSVARAQQFLKLLSSPHTTLPQMVAHISLTEQRKSVSSSAHSKWIPEAIPLLLKLSRLHTLEMRGWDWRVLGRSAATTLTPIWSRLTTLMIDGDMYFETFFILTDVLSRCSALQDLSITGSPTWTDSWYPEASRSTVIPLITLRKLQLGGSWEKHTFLEWFCSFDRGDRSEIVEFKIEQVGEDEIIPLVTYLHMYGAKLQVFSLRFTVTAVDAHDEFIELFDLGILSGIVSLQIRNLHSNCIAGFFSKSLVQLVSPSLHTLQLEFADSLDALKFVLEEVVQWVDVDTFLGGAATVAEGDKGKGKEEKKAPTSEFRFPNLAVIDIALSPFGIGAEEQKAQAGFVQAIDNPPLPQRLPICTSRDIYAGPLPAEVPHYVEVESVDDFINFEEIVDETGLPIYKNPNVDGFVYGL